MDEEIKNYEIGFLAKSESDREEMIKILKGNRFAIVGEGSLSRIKLAYPIKKENFAYFGYLYFSGNPLNIKRLTDQLKTNPGFLRFFILPQTVLKEEEEFSKNFLGRIRQSAEPPKVREFSSRAAVPPKKPVKTETLSNEALEKKLEEILK